MAYLSDFVSSDRESNGDIVVSGFSENSEMLGRLMTSHPDMDKELRTMFRKALQIARRSLTKDAAAILDSDPRKAARAVKMSVYKNVFGGNLSVLQKKRASARYELQRMRKVEQNPHQRGGNRRPYVPANSRLDQYYGADRGFILRFIASGTVQRMTRYGNRGSIPATDWFGHVAPFEMEKACAIVADGIVEYINKIANGKK